jgi:hypothetical protein
MNIFPIVLGWSPRAGGSAFASAPFSAPPRLAGGRSLGQTEQQWFSRAKTAVTTYDLLVDRTKRIASPQVRESIVSRYIGVPEDQESAIYRRNSVAQNVGEAESYNPVNYLVFGQDRVRSRVEKLEVWNRDFDAQVSAAEASYGVLPEPVVIERVVQSRAPTDITMPLVIGGLVLAGIAFLAFGS